MPANVAVIGAGVIGLTSAIELLRAGHQVTIFSRDIPKNTTSAVPAAIWFPYHVAPEAEANRWALATRARLAQLQNDPATGVRWVDFARVSRDQPPRFEKWASSEEIHWLRRDELPHRCNFGYRVSVPLMENPTYMNYLEREFRALGGELVERHLDSIAAVPQCHSIVVNCSGYGAKALCDDPDLQPGRGVIVLAEKLTTERNLVWDEHNESLMYVISRQGDCVLGGCDETSDLLATSRDEAALIMKRCAIVDGCGDVRMKTVEVGIRPVRFSGVCLRAVVLNGRTVIHNYGHGGAGFTLSWGCAEDVVKFVA